MAFPKSNEPAARSGRRISTTLRAVVAYRLSDQLSGWLIYFAVVFSPWAFGTTQLWSIWTMNVTGYLLGGLLGFKWCLRRGLGYQPLRWQPDFDHAPTRARRQHLLAGLLFGLTVMVLLYCLISALNARSTWLPESLGFQYHEVISWLPHSYDRAGTWRIFWNYTALAFLFWGTWDWLLGKTPSEERAERRAHAQSGGTALPLPARLRTLLWLLCLNGALLGLQGIAQRVSDVGKLLWLVEPRINKAPETQFGPYAYRANAAAYFNLIWPVCLGFWWTLHHHAGLRRWTHHWLLLCGVIMAACPIISSARGGALVAAGLFVLTALVFLSFSLWLPSSSRNSPLTGILTFVLLVGFFVGALALGSTFGWGTLEARMAELEQGFVGREMINQTARGMAEDYRWFGTGPGTFNPIFQLYRASPDEYWPAQLHNDWLETRITFGRAGSLMIAAAFLCVLGRWFLPGGIHSGRRFVALIWIALTGCLVHARFDLPFQIYSIVLLFLVLCALLFSMSRRGSS
ncbi:MAG: O-antigen ligase family protein [Verrucomicrobia bacterium]|nr:O-antigen ligase family protein [Verrucomicrobiota bacterium]